MIVLRIGDNIIPPLENIRRVPLPRRVSDEVADVRLDRREARLCRVPGPHLTGGADRVLLVEDRSKAFRVLLAHVMQDMLDNEVDVQRDQDPATQRVRVEKGRNVQKLGIQEALNDTHQLSGEVLLGSGKAVPQFREALAGSLKDEPLQAEAVWKAFQINRGDLAHVCGPSQGRRQFGTNGR